MNFNLKKRSQVRNQPVMDVLTTNTLNVPAGINPVAAQYLWNTIYKDDPNVHTIAEMVNMLGGTEGVERAYEKWSNPDQVADAMKPAETMQNVTQQLQDVLQETKSFNLKIAKYKKAQSPVAPPPGSPDSFVDPEIKGDQLEEQQNIMSIPQPPFAKIEDFRKWADNTDMSQVLQSISSPTGDDLKEAMEQYFSSSDEGEKGQIAAQIFSDPSFPLREEQGIMGQPTTFGEINEAIKKIAVEIVNKNKVFNFRKTAQHKTMNNAILWGPGQVRIDPFLHQPVSDWHIVERNKGFGLVVDDVWNIDYETIWRENIMDKYSRPYRDKKGNWVGGYIQKRFEVDKNIPNENNMQLKPGQLRKPVIPEHGITESRLQAARAAGDIEGAVDKSKPFNWKEAKKKS
jgi:hypothetical protein